MAEKLILYEKGEIDQNSEFGRVLSVISKQKNTEFYKWLKKGGAKIEKT